MAFSVSETEKDGCPIITLKDEANGCEAEIYAFGALLNKFCIPLANSFINIIDGFSSPADAQKNIADDFKSTKLSPFVCRMKNGEYSFEGASHKIDKYYLAGSAIHGLLFDESFTVKEKAADDEAASVTLNYDYDNPNQGFPFIYNILVSFTLKTNNQLTLSTVVTNTGTTNMPLSDGWHPYFSLGAPVNELLVQFSSRHMIEFDDGLLPTGNYIAYNTFNELKKFGDTFLDNCFELTQTNAIACILKNESNGLQLTITPSAAYPYLQIYTPPHRKSIALENLSSAPDAFNNGMGFIIAAPGSKHYFSTVYEATVV